MRGSRFVIWIAVVVALAGLTPPPALAQASYPACTVGYWPLDGNGTEAVNGFPGVEVGNVTYVLGQVGMAASLDGIGSYIINGQLVEVAPEADGDGIPDDQDVCPGTSGDALADGCDCDQILEFKPGRGGQCNAGTLNVFTNRVGWAKKVPLPGDGS